MAKIMENPIKTDDLGAPLFLETSIYIYIYIHDIHPLAVSTCCWVVMNPPKKIGRPLSIPGGYEESLCVAGYFGHPSVSLGRRICRVFKGRGKLGNPKDSVWEGWGTLGNIRVNPQGRLDVLGPGSAGIPVVIGSMG